MDGGISRKRTGVTDGDRIRGGCAAAECGGLKKRREYDERAREKRRRRKREAYETFLQ